MCTCVRGRVGGLFWWQFPNIMQLCLQLLYGHVLLALTCTFGYSIVTLVPQTYKSREPGVELIFEILTRVLAKFADFLHIITKE